MAPVEIKVVERKRRDPQITKSSKQPIKFTTKGRAVIMPKKNLPTSSDEAPRRKPKKTFTSVQKEIQELRNLVQTHPRIAAAFESDTVPPPKQSKQNILTRQRNAAKIITSASQSMRRKLALVIMQDANDIALRSNARVSGNRLPPDPKVSKTKHPSEFHIHQEQIVQDELNICTDPYNPPIQRVSGDGTILQNDQENAPNIQSGQELLKDVDSLCALYDSNLMNCGANEIPVGVDILTNIMTHPQNLENDSQKMKDSMKIIEDNTQYIKDQMKIINIENVRPLFTSPEGFPLQTMEEFDKFEGDGEKHRKLYTDLRKYGGTKLREALSTAFKASITDKLATKFSWRGDKNTKKFGNTKMAALLNRVVSKCPNFPGPASDVEFKGEMMEVLRSAKQRYRNSVEKKPHRMNKNDVHDNDDDFSEDHNSTDDEIGDQIEYEDEDEDSDGYEDKDEAASGGGNQDEGGKGFD